jgi:pimeloyl-ACP methyl ester carboxylesterase
MVVGEGTASGGAVVRSVIAAGYEIAVADLGRSLPGGTDVVLVHGIGVSGRYFGPLARQLAHTGRVLVPDLPGFGASADPAHVLSIEEHAHVLRDLVRTSGLVHPVLAGHSMGAQVVTEMAVQEPGLVERVVLLGPVTEPGTRSALRQAWRLTRDARFETRSANAIMLTDWLRAGPRRYFATVPPMIDYPLEDRLPSVEEPVLLVRGARDPVAPRDFLERLAARARSATVVEVPDEGHIVMYRRPEVVAALCRGVPR